MPHDVSTPPLLVDVAIEAKSKADHEKLVAALARLAADDEALAVSVDRVSGQIILKGTSENHIESVIDALNRTSGIAIGVGVLQVAFLEHPTQRAEAEHIHKRIYGPKGDFAAIKLAIEPNELGKGYQLERKIGVDALPNEYMPGIEKGLESVLACGVIAGYPVVDVKVQLIDGKYHDVDSSPLAFEIAASAVFRKALQIAESVLLEPIMKVEVMTPASYAASIAEDLKLRRGKNNSRAVGGDTIAIDSTVPLITMFGYANSLRAMSQGLATHTMRFDHYAATPRSDDDPPFPPAIGLRA
ncbi:hypothetical protein [Bradyrhizobium sp. CCBAU 11361]|uniref:hypothetical protein n=1 Tax=Bradyrhizobium sp. CCBAU 11361 TaxID=1630812 RepID=UPI0023036B11|nr:hypothetical protein [Bradyrhizobium sp. CCBAU 11361]